MKVPTLVLLLLAAGCAGPADPPVVSRPGTDLSVAYVGADSCRPCHLQQTSTYAETGMGRAFHPMTAEVAVEDFSDDNVFVDKRSGLHYRMEQRDGRFYQRQYQVDSNGREIAADEYELKFVVGSNNHSRGYILERDGKLFQAPICWYPRDELWDFCPGYEMKNDHFSRELQITCLQCHNGRMELVAGTRNRYLEPFPHGIGCERCHGPGQLHVDRWRSGETPTADADTTIVNPRRLPHNERLSVCFQCHLADAMATERVMRPGRDQQDYRPGQRFDEFIITFRYVEQTDYDFGLSAQADRMMLSACYRESEGRMDCLTCHDPHVSVYHELRPDDYFTQRCIACHGLDDCLESPQVRQTTSPVDDCVACHMRRAEPDDQRYTEFTDHWIRRRIDFDSRDHRRDSTIEPLDPEYLATLPAGEQKFYYARAYQLLSRDAPGDRAAEMWRRAEAAFVEAIDLGYDTAGSWFFLGKVRRNLRMRTEAEQAFRKALELEPEHHDAAFALGQLLLARGDVEAAVGLFQAMLQSDADDPMALAELGRAYTEAGRLDDALAAYGQALEQTPWTASLQMNRGMLLAARGRFEEAEHAAREAVRLNPDGIREWEFYEKVMRATERPELADEASRLLQRFRGRRTPPFAE